MTSMPLVERQAQLRAVAAELADAPPEARRAAVAALCDEMRASGASALLQLSFRYAMLGELADGEALLAEAQRPERPFSERHALYWHCYALGFRVARAAHPAYARRLRAWYRALFDEYLARIGPLPPASDAPPQPVAAVIVNQLVLPTHAPSGDALDALVHCRALGLEPFLINADDLPHTACWEFFDAKVYFRLPGLANGTVIAHAGSVYAFHHCGPVVSSPPAARRVLAAIAEARPRLVLCLGHSCLLADACRQLAPVLTVPFTCEVPASAGHGVVLRRPPTDEDRALLAELGETGTRWIVEPYTYAPPPEHPPLTREALGIAAGAYALAIVGTRLDDEMDGAASSWLTDLLAAEPRVQAVIVGCWERGPRLAAAQGWGPRARFLGYRSDLPAVLAACDGFLNPPRQGGGTSVAWALAHGLQVFSAERGDGALAAGPERIVRDAAPLIAGVRRWLDDPAWRAEQQAAARARFAALADRRGSWARILAFGEELRARCFSAPA